MSVRRWSVWLTAATIAWGAFAFGAVYPWAYLTMSVLALTAATAGRLTTRSWPRPDRHAASLSRSMVVCLSLVGAVIAFQLVPLPRKAIAAINPEMLTLLNELDLAFALGSASHSLSVSPALTAVALGLFLVLVCLMAGATSMVSTVGARRPTEMIIAIGLILAVVGIVQKPLFAGKIYGFWTPEQIGNPFGPFVNKNHFAGWMLMAVPIALGYLCAGFAKGLRGVKPGWRDRLLWASSRDASKLILGALAAGTMVLSLVLTLSRSGMFALGLALAITAAIALRRMEGRSRKVLAIGFILLLTALVLGWVGFDTIISRFSTSEWAEAGRTGAWSDALSTFKRHWVSGIGVNTYQVANVVYQAHDKESFVSEAHNDYLQIAAEGGVLLIVPVAVLIVVFLRDARRRFQQDGQSSSYWLRVGAMTGLIAIALQETADFSLQIPGNAALLAVVAAIVLHRNPATR